MKLIFFGILLAVFFAATCWGGGIFGWGKKQEPLTEEQIIANHDTPIYDTDNKLVAYETRRENVSVYRGGEKFLSTQYILYALSGTKLATVLLSERENARINMTKEKNMTEETEKIIEVWKPDLMRRHNDFVKQLEVASNFMPALRQLDADLLVYAQL
ncbi:MAG: hypothetical protein WC707_03685 [Candidatus Babeliaceae bacterium]